MSWSSRRCIPVLAEGLNRLSDEAAAQDLSLLISEVHITAGSMIIYLSREALAQSLALHPDELMTCPRSSLSHNESLACS
jgi:hypothetical protein